ncbi:hypothetical protein [Pandoraea fibrosis]|uniref:Uncharacterized protein n=1 Tax=Pandoraea fibrosis TaxID=1891094 RepID=A0A5E4XFF2_9BURK|nr:hypothetical protein [Pandoraea fibrosis]VVE34905.1 hypothetical protein PFI31113_03808 [Pandoraea fibrosis]
MAGVSLTVSGYHIAKRLEFDMDEFEPDDEWGDPPQYRRAAEIEVHEMRDALGQLYLFSHDGVMRRQAFNLSIVDRFICELEMKLAETRLHEYQHFWPETALINAQTQMWIFALYELLRTWTRRVSHIVKLIARDGVTRRIHELKSDVGFLHVEQLARVKQLEAVLADPNATSTIAAHLRHTHVLFGLVSALRVQLAKHEESGNPNSIAYGPDFASINRYCGSMEFVISKGGADLVPSAISRRDIAEALRAINVNSEPPDQACLDSFDMAMRGPTRV